MKKAGAGVLAGALMLWATSSIGQPAESVSKLEIEEVLVGKTIVFDDGRRVTLGRDGTYLIEKDGRLVARAQYALPAGNLLAVNWGPRNEQRDLFYKENGKYYVVDRWGRRARVVSLVDAPDPGDITGSTPKAVERLSVDVRLSVEVSPAMIEAGVRALTQSNVADDSLATRALVARVFRDMLAARVRGAAAP